MARAGTEWQGMAIEELEAHHADGAYAEVDIDDMDYDDDQGLYTYKCPCGAYVSVASAFFPVNPNPPRRIAHAAGDLFQISEEELEAGEEIAHCPSCSLILRVIYDPEEFAPIVLQPAQPQRAPSPAPGFEPGPETQREPEAEGEAESEVGPGESVASLEASRVAAALVGGVIARALATAEAELPSTYQPEPEPQPQAEAGRVAVTAEAAEAARVGRVAKMEGGGSAEDATGG